MRHARLLLLLPMLACFSACAMFGGGDADAGRRERLDKEIATFYETVADAYFLAGWEFYELAKEMEKSGKTDDSVRYYHKAHVLSNFASELRKRAGKSAGKPDMSLPRVPSEME